MSLRKMGNLFLVVSTWTFTLLSVAPQTSTLTLFTMLRTLMECNVKIRYIRDATDKFLGGKVRLNKLGTDQRQNFAKN